MPIAAAVFALVVTVVLGGYWLFVIRLEDREERELRKRLKTRRTSVFGPAVVKAQEKLSVLGPLDAVLAKWRVGAEPLTRLIRQSGLQLNIGAVVLGSVFLGLTAAIAVAYAVSSGWPALLAGAMGTCLPFAYLHRSARKRLEAFEEQFPEAADLLARALRAGHAFTTAVQMVADEIPDPAGAEFRLLYEQQNYGMSLPDALKAFADRVPVLDARFFVTAVLTQRETGGNLAEVLDNLASVIRERFKVKRQVRVISAHGRITGWVLGFLPPGVALILFVLAPDHMRLLVNDPLGLDMVIGAILLQVIGVLAIRRIVDVEY
jgi:tight adherence protein B